MQPPLRVENDEPQSACGFDDAWSRTAVRRDELHAVRRDLANETLLSLDRGPPILPAVRPVMIPGHHDTMRTRIAYQGQLHADAPLRFGEIDAGVRHATRIDVVAEK